MEFSVKWAAASAAYVGMAFGAWRMWSMGTAPVQRAFAAGAGMFMGGGLALPLAATNLAAALLALWLTRGQGFATQFGAFAAMSCVFYVVVLRWLDAGLRTMGGLHLDKEMGFHAAFVLATFVVALALMAWAPARHAA